MMMTLRRKRRRNEIWPRGGQDEGDEGTEGGEMASHPKLELYTDKIMIMMTDKT